MKKLVYIVSILAIILCSRSLGMIFYSKSNYIDGVVQSLSTQADSGWGVSTPYVIGKGYNYPTYHTRCKLSDMRLYARALSVDEVLKVYNAGK